MSKMSYRFSSDDLRLKTGIGIREPSAIRIPMINGTALYGPYVDLLAGRYEAVIRFDPETPCHGGAMMDVCAGVGAERLAEQWITADLIRAGDLSAKLDFFCPRFSHGVEVRLLTDGGFSAGILSVEIRGELTECGSELEMQEEMNNALRLLRPYPSSEYLISHNPMLRKPLDEISGELASETREEIKNALRLLHPYAVEGFSKARFGTPYDGGYVLLDDFRGIDTALSFGVEQNASWEVDVAKRGVTVYQFDHTVDAPITDNPRLIFTRKKISAEAGPDSESLSSLIKRHDKRDAHPNILLKIDIENDEWAVFDATPSELLSRFSQIVGEFHYFEGFSDLRCRRLFTRVLKKLTNAYAVVHLHANNCAGSSNVANVFFPNVLEITFANRNIYRLAETDETFPGPLDAPNDPSRPDLHLGSFRF
jgi:hypothetical protein